MGSEWLKNMSGLSLDDDHMQIIPYPTTELALHVTAKTVQAGGLLGFVLFGPVAAAFRKETRNWDGVKRKMMRAGRNGLIVGVILGPIMTCMAMRKEEASAIYDRCYRLRYNRGQVRCDELSLIGAGIGTGAGYMSSVGPLFGGLLGMTSGIFLSAFITNFLLKK